MANLLLVLGNSVNSVQKKGMFLEESFGEVYRLMVDFPGSDLLVDVGWVSRLKV